jgi:hypothetical protein
LLARTKPEGREESIEARQDPPHSQEQEDEGLEELLREVLSDGH